MFFRNKRLLPSHEAEWVAEQFADFAARFGPSYLAQRPLILPTRDFFDAPKSTDHATAETVFAQIKQALALDASWDVRLVAQAPRPAQHQVADTILIAHDDQTPFGTFSIDEQGPLITYDPDLLSNPRAFIATMAHELAHYMMAAYPSPEGPFEEPMLEELATEILVYATGFGVISLATIFSAQAGSDAFSQSWSISNRGYISRETGAFALALFLRLTGQSPDLAFPHLDSHNIRLLKIGLAQVDRDPDLIVISQGVRP